MTVLLAAANAFADPAASGRSLEWDPAWPRFQPAEYVVTGAAGVASIGVFYFVRMHSQPNWTGGILFDDAVRDAIRVRSPGALATVRTLSDVVGVSEILIVAGIDSVAVPLARGRAHVALQLTLMNAESFALSTLLTTSLYDTIGRDRPSHADCVRDPSFDPLCNVGRYASFPSGHTNEAFTAAGLSCAHHGHLPLYGGGLADTLACVRDLTLATSVAVLRVAGDRHYATDVLAGGALGFGFGYGLPMLLHYRGGPTGHRISLAPVGGYAVLGLSAAGDF